MGQLVHLPPVPRPTLSLRPPRVEYWLGDVIGITEHADGSLTCATLAERMTYQEALRFATLNGLVLEMSFEGLSNLQPRAVAPAPVPGPPLDTASEATFAQWLNDPSLRTIEEYAESGGWPAPPPASRDPGIVVGRDDRYAMWSAIMLTIAMVLVGWIIGSWLR